MNKKRLRAFWLAVVFAVSAVVPVRQANAVVPLIGLAVAAIGPGGTLLTADLLTAGVTSLIGGSIVALALTPSTADAPTRVPLMSDKPTIDAVMPPPAAASSVAPTQSTTGVWSDGWGGSGYTSAAAACSAAGAAQLGWCQGMSSDWTGGSGTLTGASSCSATCCLSSGGCNTFPQSISSQSTTVQTCGSGYTLSGNTCVLAEARATAPDGKYDVSRSASGFTAPGSTGEADSMPAYMSSAGGKVYAQGKNSAGQPVMIEYAVSADGTKTYITHYTQSEDATQTTVKTQAITVDAATGAVTGATTGTAAGSISPATQVGAVPTVSTGAAVTSGASTNTSSLVLPTDYARTGEAGAAANTINTKLDTLHKDLTEKGTDIADPESPQASAFSDAFFNGTFGNLLAWQLPGHTSVCPTITFDYMMFSSHQVHVMDAQCTISEQIRPVLNVVMIVCWTIVALFVLLEA